MSVCIQYSRPASTQNDNEVFGFDVAVTRFLSAYFRHSAVQQFICRPTDIPSFDHFKSLAAAEGIDAATQCVGLDPRTPDKNLESISCIFRPDPLTADLIWRRQQMKGQGFATCGLVHTMSGERIARAVGDLCYAPSDATDALICPSVAIRDAVRTLWNIQSDYINFRFKGSFACPIQTPVIPLGIDTAKFEKVTTPEKRKAQRDALNVTDDEIVILFVGRLSFATKAHPLPMLMAAERAAKRTGRKVRLVMYGYFLPKDMEPPFRNLASDICKTARAEFVMNTDPRFPDGLWAAADVFTSLSENIQESFGLTPIEAMACGLPSVITDWDGYREGVRNGQDGFLVPTLTPPTSAGLEIARYYFNENNYGLGLTAASQSTSVDIEGCAQSYAKLATDPDLRHNFGASARTRAQSVFDWKHVIAAYDELWNALAEKRKSLINLQGVPENWQAVHPAYPNPLEMFKAFPTAQLQGTDILRVVMDEADIDMILRHEMNLFVPQLLLPRGQLLELIAAIRNAKAARIQDVLAPFPRQTHDLLWRCFGWMLKNGICAFERPRP